ncbi:MAG: response regulator [Eubacteriales bacterium]|jgi:two-component system response regulator VicR|nr:response regulator transcription factor [Clostridiales bacterium]MDD6915815.1 response regulator [Eubacteriales bacterium]MDY4212582.1 response regulator [Eubacteriales bacterium]MDY5231231.1 response regulator [Eubacteriales bacterium]
MGKRILVVDDEKSIVDILRLNLQKEGYTVSEAYDGAEAVEKALAENSEDRPDLILLDVMLPEMNGFDVCKKIRESSTVPIVMITAREDEVDKVLGLEIGADDYVTKPFSMRELLARVKANMRRVEIEPIKEDNNDIIEVGCFKLDCNRYELYKGDKLIDLTVREFELIKFLSAQPNKIYSRKSLLEYVWDYEYYGDVRTVDVTVRRVREKIEEDPSQPKHIMTKRGVGYYFAL